MVWGEEGTTRERHHLLNLERGDHFKEIASPLNSSGFQVAKGTGSKQEGSTPNS